MLDIAEDLLMALREGERVALATVIGVRGSTPREPGTRMVIRRGGSHLGTVGGGCGEAEVIRTGMDCLDDERPRLVKAEMLEEVTEEAGAACGGTMDVVVAPFGAELTSFVEAARGAAEERRTVRLLTVVEPARALGAMVAVVDGRVVARVGLNEDEAAALAGLPASGTAAPGGVCAPARTRTLIPGPAEGWTIFSDEIVLPALLLICGGGHIALPLSEMAKVLGFDVTVIDDRPSFADPRRFQEADRVICASFEQALADFSVDARTCAVVVTRGHRHDVICVRRLLGRGAAYVGMIGSRRRVAGVLEMLKAEGYGEAALGELYSPIGLDIGAETPAEIALAILAEIVQVRRGGGSRHLSLTGAGRKGEK